MQKLRWQIEKDGIYFERNKNTLVRYPVEMLKIPLVKLRFLPCFSDFVLARQVPPARDAEKELKDLFFDHFDKGPLG